MIEKGQHTIWHLMYEPYELFTDVRKRNQIELIKDIVYALKQDFNKEFVELEEFKDAQTYVIKEKNE